MFVALEVLSLPLYLLAGLARRRRLLSQEAALKYFLLGAFSSAFFLYGAALLYGFAGTVSLGGIAEALTASASDTGLLIAGTALLVRRPAVQDRRRAVPPVDAGRLPGLARPRSPAFMAACTKVAAFGALLRVMYVALGGIRWDWRPMMYVIAALTMIVGHAVRADPDRHQAHARLLLDRAAPASCSSASSRPTRRASRARCSTCWPTASPRIGAFAIVTLVRDSTGEATHLSQWAGLGKRSPLVAERLRAVPAGLRRHPAHQRLHRQVRGLHRGHRRRRHPGGRRRRAGLAPSRRSSTSASSCSCSSTSPQPRVAPSVVVPSSFTTFAITVAVALTLVIGVLPQLVLDLVQQAGDLRPLTTEHEERERRERRPALRAVARRRGPGRLACGSGLDDVEIAPAQGGDERLPVRHRGLEPPGQRRRQAVPPAAGARGRAVRRPGRARQRARRRRRRAHPPRDAVPRRRDGRGAAAPRRPVGQRALGQHGRDPHRRLPVRPRLRHRWPTSAPTSCGCRRAPSSGCAPGRSARPSARPRARTRSRTTSTCSPTRPAR